MELVQAQRTGELYERFPQLIYGRFEIGKF